MTYKSYKILTLTVNPKGGEDEKVEHLYKEVEDTLIPMTKEEAKLEFFGRLSKIGGNPATQDIKMYLLNPSGDVERIDEVNKPVNEEINIKKYKATKALEVYMNDPTDENLAKIKAIVTEE